MLNETLIDWQNALVAAIVDDESSSVHALVSQPERVAVYQNNARHGLVGVLKLNYEHCAQVLGDVYFDSLAMRFVRACFPNENSLNCYDERFVDFIEQQASLEEGLSELPYLVDLARLDFAMTRCGHASSDDPTALARFSNAPPEQQMNAVVKVGSGVCVLTSAWPLADIVRLNRGEIDEVSLDDTTSLRSYCVAQIDGQIAVNEMTPSQAELLVAAQQGAPLATLIEAFEEGVPFLLDALQQGVLVIEAT
ncbi:MAG: DNA-binding domain-containing protein [Pseudomonadota bacterium]